VSQQIIDFATYADKLFSKVFYQVRKVKSRIVVIYGGAGSSKSYSVHQNELINLMQGNHDTLILRKTGSDLRDSSYKLFEQLINSMGLRHLFTSSFYSDNRRITYIPTGKSLIFKGVDDSEKLKSIVGIQRIVMEEASQFDFEDFLEINRRARGVEDIQITLILNPVSEKHWIKRKLCDEGSPYANDTTVLRFTYSDNKFLTASDIAELERLKYVNENQYRIYVLAEWGIDDNSNRFAYSFNEDKHTGLCEFLDKEAIYLSFDFNRDPISCTVFQEKDGVIRVPYVIKLATSNIYELCDHIIAKFGRKLFMVTGDATGKSSSAMVQDDINYYTIIRQKLKLSAGQLQVPSVNPRVRENRVLVNAILEHKKVLIDKVNAAPLIYDLLYCEVDGNGDLVKDRSNDKRKADILDEFRYYLNTYHSDFLEMVGR
jgi:phage terminase large subunit